MTWQDKVGAIFGVIFIAIGLAYFLSPRFADFAFTYTGQGVIWKYLIGEKRAPLVAKSFFSLVSIILGIWVLYSAIMGT